MYVAITVPQLYFNSYAHWVGMEQKITCTPTFDSKWNLHNKKRMANTYIRTCT